MSFMRVIDAGRGRTCDGVGGRPMEPNVGIGGVAIFEGSGRADIRGGGDKVDARTMCAGNGGGDERIGSGGGAFDVRAGIGGGVLRRTASIVVVADVSATDELASLDGRARHSTAYAPGRHVCCRPAYGSSCKSHPSIRIPTMLVGSALNARSRRDTEMHALSLNV